MRLGTKRPPITSLLLFLVAIGVCFIFLAQTLPDVADTMGYVYAGQRLAAGDGVTLEDPNNQLAGPFFSMFAFQIRQPNDFRMFLGFPPGFPLLLATGIWLTGQANAIHYVVPVLSIISLIVTFFLGKLITGNEWSGLFATVLVALTPAFWQFSVAAWSEVPTMAVGTLGVLLYLYSRQENVSLKRAILLSVLGGLLINFSLFIRYANITLFPALALFEVVAARKKILTERWRWPFWIILGLGVGAILLFNQGYYGGLFLSSYSPEHGWYPQAPFSFSYALQPSFIDGRSLIEAGKTLWNNFSLLLFLIPLGWWVLKRPFALLLSIASITSIALYSMYAFAPTGINSRFLIPIFPFIAIPIAQAIVHFGTQFSNKRYYWALLLFIFVLAAWSVPESFQTLRERNKQIVAMVTTIEELVAPMEANAVVISYSLNDQLFFYGKRSVLNHRRIPPSDLALGEYRYEYIEPCLVQTVDRLLQDDIPVYYLETSTAWWDVMPFEILEKYYQVEQLPNQSGYHVLPQASGNIVRETSLCMP